MKQLHVFSMTSTLLALIDGKITLDALQNAKFYFGCSKEHVLSDGLVPHEATWKNRNRKVGYPSDGTERTITDVDEDKREMVLVFIKLITEADTNNMVQWRTSQHDILKTLPEDALCLSSGEFITVGEKLR